MEITNLGDRDSHAHTQILLVETGTLPSASNVLRTQRSPLQANMRYTCTESPPIRNAFTFVLAETVTLFAAEPMNIAMLATNKHTHTHTCVLRMLLLHSSHVWLDET